MTLPARLGIEACWALCALVLLARPSAALASGPLERLVQLIQHPTDAQTKVLRYGVASEGLLFSRDGGRSFRAICTRAIASDLDGISPRGTQHETLSTLDGDGKLLLVAANAVWSDDGTGCGWTKADAIAGKFPTGLTVDPGDAHQVLALATAPLGEGDALEVQAQLLRRDAAGAWTLAGLLKQTKPGARAQPGNLLGVRTEAGSLLYASVTFTPAATEPGPTVTSVVSSSDGGKTWVDRGALPADQAQLRLLAVDPTEPSRLLAVAPARNTQVLLVSEDGGASFRRYGAVYKLAGVALSPRGQVYIGDAGDSTSFERTGGVYTAARLGAPLALLAQPANANPAVDCLGYDAARETLLACRFHRFGTLATDTGVFTQLTQLEGVQGLVACPGRDMSAVCEAELNAGPTWCCTGHYPFTSFCGAYDITEVAGRPVACGLSGREADLRAGRRPQVATEPMSTAP